MDEEIRCNDCDWTGDSSELVSETSGLDDPCNICPTCGSADIEDLEDIGYE